MAVFRHFLHLARRLQIPWHGRRMVRGPEFGDKTMSISLTIQQLAVSVIGALLASSLFISAAVGPVPVI
ncbi:MAG TPA: hypothetical protein VJS15_04630 [Allosphingosinicella sp.]|nr:hypothetical protein [Allosphingosinicella sp.]